MENSRKCETGNVDVRRASMQKFLRSRKHLENEKQNDMIIPECWLGNNKHLLKTNFKKYITLKH